MTTENFALASLPPELQAEAMQLQQRRAMTDALLAHSLQGSPMPTNPGRLASRMNPLQPIAQMLAGGLAGRAGRDLNTQEVALGQKSNQYLTDVLMRSQALRSGSPAVAGTPDSSADGLPSTPGTPATAGNDDVANALLMNHPATRGLGLEMMKRNMEMAAFKKLAGGTGGGGIPGTAGAPAVGPGMPGFGGPAGGQSMELWLQSDPTGKLYMEQLAKDYTKANEPVVNRGYGLGRMVNGKYVPDEASLAQATGMEQKKADIAAPLETPIGLEMSNGQKYQLSRPEYREFQLSGKLPTRYTGGSPEGAAGWLGKEPEGQFTGDPAQIQAELAAIKDPAERAAAQRALQNQMGGKTIAAPLPAAVGVPGATQTQADIIRQKQDTAAAEQIGTGMGKEATAVYTDGAKAVQANRQLDNMRQATKDFNPGRLQGLKATFASYLNGVGVPEAMVNKFLQTNVGDIQALTSQAIQLAGHMTRESDSQPSQIQFLKNLQSTPNAGQTVDGFNKVIDYMKDLNNYKIEKMIAQQDWLGSHPSIQGFEPAWVEKAKSLPFVWNKKDDPPVDKMKAPTPPKADAAAPIVRAMPDAVPGAPPPAVGAQHRPGNTRPANIDEALWNVMTPEEKALWK